MMNSFVNATMDDSLSIEYSRAYSARMKTLADRLDSAMREHDLSQSALSRASGVPQPTINRILKGLTLKPDTETTRKLAAAIGVSLEWLLDGVEGGTNSVNKSQSTPLSDEANSLIREVERLDAAGGLPRKLFPLVRRMLAATSESPENKMYAPGMKDVREAQMNLEGLMHESERRKGTRKSR